MKIDEILLLVKAGYTRQEINAMSKAATAEDLPAPAPAPAPVPAPAPALAPAPVPAPAADASAILSAIDGLGAKITAAMQAASLSAAMMRTPPENESVEQIVASIINPKE